MSWHTLAWPTKLIILSGVSILLGVGLAAGVLYQRSVKQQERELQQALAQLNLELAPDTLPKLPVRYGFLPYWLMSDATISSELTHVAYFSISVDGTGNFVQKIGRNAEPGWHTYQSDRFQSLHTRTTAQNQKLLMTLAVMHDSDIEQLLGDPQAQKTLARNTQQLMQAESLDGINLDVEYLSSASAQLQSQYVELTRTLSTAVHQQKPDAEFSIDIYASAGSPNRIWDLPQLVPLVDHFVVMEYDFYHSSSTTAGPVAPVFGKFQGKWKIDIMSSLKAITDQVPAQKLLFGIPLYGYEWRTTEQQFGATTFPRTGRTVPLKSVPQLFTQPGATTSWDWDALSPYLTYMQNGYFKLVAFENERSLRYKLRLAQSVGMDGIAFWALGYESPDDPVWSLLHDVSP